MLWDLNPIILQIGFLQIRWYGLVYALGFLLGYLVLLRAARAKRIEGFTERDAETFLLWLIIGSILGARLIYCLVYNPSFYLANPEQLIFVHQGGLSIHGGILGAAVAIWGFCRNRKVSFLELSDVLVLPLSLVLVFGRIANYVNGELWGTVTGVPWCVDFPGAEGCRHPNQLYEAGYSLVLFSSLLVIEMRKRLKRGIVTWWFLLLYGALRFLVTFFRELDLTDPGILGLGLGQWLSLLMVVAGIIGLVYSRK